MPGKRITRHQESLYMSKRQQGKSQETAAAKAAISERSGRFAFHFYNYGTFNVLVNPNNPVVQTVLNRMLETGDYFFFAVDPKGSVTAFRSELGQEDLTGLKTNLPLFQNAKTTDAQYRKALALFEKNPDPPGRMLSWVCHDDTDYLDLTHYREDLNPAPQSVNPKKSTAPDEIIESSLIPCDRCGELAAQLIFVDDSTDINKIEECARKMVVQYSDLNVPTWIIGEPLGTPGYDTKTRILKVWPNREPIQLKTANEFNEELDELLARHCKSEDGYADDSMMGDLQQVKQDGLGRRRH